MPLGAIILLSAWCAAWAALVPRMCAMRDAPAFGSVLAAFSAATCVLLFVVWPVLGGEIGRVALWVHHAALFGLGGFLLGAEVLRELCRRAPTPGTYRISVRRLRWLTELAPGAAAIALLLSGLRLIQDSPAGLSLREPWLFWLVVAFAFFFSDGLCFYLPAVRHMDETGALPRKWDALQLSLHAASFPLVVALAAARWPLPHPLRPLVVNVENALGVLPGGCARAAVAAAMVAVVSGGVWFVRRRRRRLRA